MTTSDSNIQRTVDFFEGAIPEPKDKNFHTQIGVHFEEVAEMMSELQAKTQETQYILTMGIQALSALSMYFKANEGIVTIKDRVAFADSLGDQIVTATDIGYMAHIAMAGVMGEINRSNLSKFNDNGEALLDENRKIIKGPNYFQPNLEPFV
jgi:hypothetical protein